MPSKTHPCVAAQVVYLGVGQFAADGRHSLKRLRSLQVIAEGLEEVPEDDLSNERSTAGDEAASLPPQDLTDADAERRRADMVAKMALDTTTAEEVDIKSREQCALATKPAPVCSDTCFCSPFGAYARRQVPDLVFGDSTVVSASEVIGSVPFSFCLWDQVEEAHQHNALQGLRLLVLGSEGSPECSLQSQGLILCQI